VAALKRALPHKTLPRARQSRGRRSLHVYGAWNRLLLDSKNIG
jgi:hypothetical protein